MSNKKRIKMYSIIGENDVKQKSYFKWCFNPVIILTYTPSICNEFGYNEFTYSSDIGMAYGCELSRKEYYKFVKNGKIDLIEFIKYKLAPFLDTEFNYYYRNLYDKIYMSLIKSTKFTDIMTENEVVEAYLKKLGSKKYIDIDIYDCIIASYFLKACKITHLPSKETKRIVYAIHN